MSRIFIILFVAFVMAQLFSNKFVLHVRNRARHGEEVFWTDYTRDGARGEHGKVQGGINNLSFHSFSSSSLFHIP